MLQVTYIHPPIKSNKGWYMSKIQAAHSLSKRLSINHYPMIPFSQGCLYPQEHSKYHLRRSTGSGGHQIRVQLSVSNCNWNMAQCFCIGNIWQCIISHMLHKEAHNPHSSSVVPKIQSSLCSLSSESRGCQREAIDEVTDRSDQPKEDKQASDSQEYEKGVP